MAVIDEILSGCEALRPGQEASYEDLHRHPELSHQEHRTARRVGDGYTDDSLLKRIPVPDVALAWPAP
jgi:metal-dependent amidase/aminoacylase/carboxypeptidase family protein